MPEMIEVEAYRRVAERVVGRRVKAVDAPDAWYLKRGLTAEILAVLVGQQVVGTLRIGKLLVLEMDSCRLGLRFGMTGRLFVDGTAGVEGLLYSSQRPDSTWDRFGLRFAGGGDMRMHDPRRLGGVELEPDLARLGPDALTVSYRDFRTVLEGSDAPLKARLLDQSRIAGIGNLIADEVLWQAGIDPAGAAGSLSAVRARRLHHVMVATITELIRRGGSHTGDLQKARTRGALCPRDGAPLLRRTIGGRTTFSCPRHQR